MKPTVGASGRPSSARQSAGRAGAEALETLDVDAVRVHEHALLRHAIGDELVLQHV